MHDVAVYRYETGIKTGDACEISIFGFDFDRLAGMFDKRDPRAIICTTRGDIASCSGSGGEKRRAANFKLWAGEKECEELAHGLTVALSVQHSSKRCISGLK